MSTREHSPFVVRLRDIPQHGQPFALTLPEDWTRATLGKTPLEWAAQSLAVTAQLHKTERDVVVVGELAGELSCACSRCTGPAKVPLRAPFELVFVPAGDARLVDETATEDSEEDEQAPSGSELIAYHDEAIDLDQPLREQLLLALPYAPLCKTDCKGLCPSCGTDRNTSTCACASAPEVRVDHRWDKLKNVKLT